MHDRTTDRSDQAAGRMGTPPADRFDAFFFDMDGVLCLGNRPIPGAAETLNALRSRGKIIRVLTNNPRLGRAEILARFETMGFDLDPAELFNVGIVTGRWLVAEYGAGCEVYVMGGDGLRRDLEACGVRIVDKEDVPVVVVASSETITYDDIHQASRRIRAGARFIATNVDALYPGPNGYVPGTGAFVKAVAVAAGVEPTVIGKPHRLMFDVALQSLPEPLQRDTSRIAMVGDNPATDIAGAVAAGVTPIWINADPSRRHAFPEGGAPRFELRSVRELLDPVP